MNHARLASRLFLLTTIIGAGFSATEAQCGAPRQERAKTTIQSGSPWTEPTSFLGLELGKSISKQSAVIVKCPAKPLFGGSTTMFRDSSFKGYCYDASLVMDDVALAYGGPDLGVRYKMAVILDDETLRGVILTIQSQMKDQFFALLKARYGEPHTTIVGASFVGNRYVWSGPNISIQFSEYGLSIEESNFQIKTRARLDPIKAS
jgi:hypothetical protein